MAKASMRMFLNTEPHGGMAAAWGVVHDPNDYGTLNASLVISDCNTSITLDLSVHSEETLKNTYNKLHTLGAIVDKTLRELDTRVPAWRKAKAEYESKKQEEAEPELIRRPRRRRRTRANA